MYVDKEMSVGVISSLLQKKNAHIMDVLVKSGVKLRGQESKVKKRYHI